MSQLAGKVLDEVKVESTGRNILWEVEILPDVRGAPSMMRLVARNLLSNAEKYSLLRDSAMIKLGSISDEREIVVLIRDHHGVRCDIQCPDKRFGVFQRSYNAEEFEGTDIGLASVRQIVDRRAGRVWADGGVGKGVTVYFSLPRSTESIDG